MLQLLQVQHQVVTPESRPLANRRWLGRLQMSESQARQVTIGSGKQRQVMNHAHQAITDQLQRLHQQKQIGVVGHETTGRTQVDDPSGFRTLVSVGMHVSHHVMTQVAFVVGRHLKVNVLDSRPH